MTKLSTLFDKAKMGSAAFVVALGTAIGTTAHAGPEHTIKFNGHVLNCATLQGHQNLIPNGMTCGFVAEVEQYIKGPKLKCNPDLEGHSFDAMQSASRHMAMSHGQPALFKYLEATIAIINARARGTKVLEELEKTHPGEAFDYYLTYLAIEGTATRVQKGESPDGAMTAIARLMDEKGYKFSGNQGTALESVREIFAKNRVVDAALACREKFPKPVWSHYERR